MKIAIGTLRKPKIDGVKKAVETCPYFDSFRDSIQYVSMETPSDISHMPISIEQIMLGANNRARNLLQSVPGADYFVGIEGGTERFGEKSYVFGCVFILNNKGEGHYGFSPMVEVPSIIDDMIYKEGKELGPIMKELSGGKDVRSENGSMGMWTDNMLVRRDEFVLAFYSAIAPFFNEYYLKK
ncbi:MAG: DUF84 family protein [Candidatus Moraniibacteriota bacterium]|nr:MAG: DUF84 family protein [Candidatus Moranbacteria bacterium]